MGLFKKIKKAFKKVTGFVKKVVKKVVKGVKKVAKKIGSSKILKALAIAAAVVVTGGAALTAFGGTGALATSQFGTWMMSTSQAVLGGTAFGSAAAMKPGVGKFLTQTGNFLAKTAAKPFGAVGGALGSTARVGVNLVTPGTGAFSPGTAVGAPAPFSSAALSGQLDTSQITYDPVNEGYLNNKTGMPLTADEVAKLPESFTSTINKAGGSLDSSGNIVDVSTSDSTQSGFRQVAGRIGETVAGSVLSGAAAQYIAGDPKTQGSMAGGAVEGAEFMDPLKVYAAQQGINTDNIYQHMMYGNADPSSMYGNDLYRQQTFGVA